MQVNSTSDVVADMSMKLFAARVALNVQLEFLAAAHTIRSLLY